MLSNLRPPRRGAAVPAGAAGDRRPARPPRPSRRAPTSAPMPAAPSSGSATASSITTTACTGTTTTWSASGEPEAKNRSTSLTISGSGLDWHDMAAYLQPDGIGKYSFVPGNKIVFNPPGRQFDTVVMMDCSQCPVHPQLAGAFHATVKKNAAIIAKYGARPVLFMSWAYKDAPEMTAQLAEQYTIAGNANDALVIPAGLAFAKAVARRPELELYQPDKRHPTLAGTYLAACTTLRGAPQEVAGRQQVHRRARPGSWRPSCRRWRRTRSASTTPARAGRRPPSARRACARARRRPAARAGGRRCARARAARARSARPSA